MFKILIDTCVWLDLAKDSEETLITVLEELTQNKDISIITPEVVLTEFNNNRDKIIKESSKSLSSIFKRVKDAVDKFGDPKERKLYWIN